MTSHWQGHWILIQKVRVPILCLMRLQYFSYLTPDKWLFRMVRALDWWCFLWKKLLILLRKITELFTTPFDFGSFLKFIGYSTFWKYFSDSSHGMLNFVMRIYCLIKRFIFNVILKFFLLELFTNFSFLLNIFFIYWHVKNWNFISFNNRKTIKIKFLFLYWSQIKICVYIFNCGSK